MTMMRVRTAIDAGLLGGVQRAPGAADMAAQVAALQRAARIPSPNTWHAGESLRDARNAHRTNLVTELRAALAGPYDYFEGDVRMRGNVPVMAHDVDQVPAAMTLQDWIGVCAISGRGLKLDCKDASVIEAAIRGLRDAHVPDDRVLFNVGAGATSPKEARVTVQQLRDIRAAFPNATINLDPGPAPYDPRDIAHVLDVARRVGGRVMFPLDAKAVTPTLVAQLQQVGPVAVWNDPATYAPGDIQAATARFRAMGVDGTIDLRGATGLAALR